MSRELTPCVGRCSTVFGDLVCRGCRRFNHEVIAWNRYTPEQQQAVWARLDAQLDQILVPMLPHYNLNLVEQFLIEKQLGLMPNASLGRKLYQALKFCEKHPHTIDESGLNIVPEGIFIVWQNFERKILALATASYELAWLRVEAIGSDGNASPP